MQDLPTAPKRTIPHPLRSLIVMLVTGYIWYLVNIEMGSIPAIQASGWFRGLTEWRVLFLALSGSAVQLYITKEWDVADSLFNRSKLFRWGSAALLFLWDIAFPAWGLLVIRGIAFNWTAYGIAIAAQLAGSWWAQQAAVGALEDVVRVLLRRTSTTADTNDPDDDADEDEVFVLPGMNAYVGSAKK